MSVNERYLRLAVAAFVALFGLVIIAAEFSDIFDRTPSGSVPEDVAALVLLGALPFVLGVWLFVQTLVSASKRAFQARELTVLRLARDHHGVLTVSQVARESDMTVEQAEEILKHLYHKSMNEMTLSDSGEMVYRFPVRQRRSRHD